MAGWRDIILSEFQPHIARLTLVADPDGLLLEEGIFEEMRARGFDLIPFDDNVAFRYIYESKFRSRWDNGEETDSMAVLRLTSNELDLLPYDLLQAGRKVSISLADIFPNLSYPIVATLDFIYLDTLFQAQEKFSPGRLGDNATKSFILRSVFEIIPEFIKEPKDLLLVLLRRHYLGMRIPPIVDEYLIQFLQQNEMFKDWPLDIIVSDRQAFFAFLQERWPIFLNTLALKGNEVCEEPSRYGLRFSGPALLPFDHEEIRVYIDDLFREGLLHPVPCREAQLPKEHWTKFGITIDPEESYYRRIVGLMDSVEENLKDNMRHEMWLHFAYKWAELLALEFTSDFVLPDTYKERMDALKSKIDGMFQDWILKRYASLINLSPASPVMLHHIPRFLARNLAGDKRTKVAFLLIDGLALDQWITLRNVLKELDSRLQFRESAVFAWIPTLTSVSRQAAFAGKPPMFFPTNIRTTDRESNLWAQFWAEQGLSANDIAYIRWLGNEISSKHYEVLKQDRLRVAGLVVDKIDRIMHGMQLGTAGMHNQIWQWTKQGFMRDLLSILIDSNFRVYITSDHGNIEAKGIGCPNEGVTAELRGERVRIYSDPSLRTKCKMSFPDSLEWPSIGLPEDYYALIAPSRAAFIRKDDVIVSHGGISIEEVIAPFIEVERA
ncbi:BREX-3 system phosphatase PglZ [Acetomicrobium sp. UBA5826]|uniref:BREX-3 system phosphatase PglZ n=1 Tax=Acetomicrobium sp. UBA5826 TaxID=1946039 RepID=UPI00257C3B86|nr:BREX-3 system phosphatase PglZ [Acetomicrobium sp. UBA5826]